MQLKYLVAVKYMLFIGYLLHHQKNSTDAYSGQILENNI